VPSEPGAAPDVVDVDEGTDERHCCRSSCDVSHDAHEERLPRAWLNCVLQLVGDHTGESALEVEHHQETSVHRCIRRIRHPADALALDPTLDFRLTVSSRFAEASARAEAELAKVDAAAAAATRQQELEQQQALSAALKHGRNAIHPVRHGGDMSDLALGLAAHPALLVGPATTDPSDWNGGAGSAARRDLRVSEIKPVTPPPLRARNRPMLAATGRL